MRTRSALVMLAALVGSLVVPSGPPAAATTDPTAFVTIGAGRAFFQGADRGCNAYGDDVTVDLLEVAQQLRDRPRPITVYGTIQGAFIKSGTRYCPGAAGYHDYYPTWQDLAALRDTYGWSFGSNGRVLGSMTKAGRTPSQQWNSSCGALRDLRSHGHARGSSLFNYPGGGDPNDVSGAIQRDYVSQCFSFGRKYDNDPPFERNQRSDEGSRTANPHGWQWTHNIYGGLCNLPEAPCSSETIQPFRRYESPATLATLLSPGPDEWSVLQFHAFVDGQRLTGDGDHWDCTDSDWRRHWASRPELYCWDDFLTAIDAIPSNVTIADPATVAAHWGRTLPNPRVLQATPAAAAAGVEVMLKTTNVRAIGSPANSYINGNGLSVKFGTVRAVVLSASPTAVRVRVPKLATAGPTPITLVNGDGTTTKAAGLFTYRA